MNTIKLKMHQLLDMSTLLEFVRLESAMHSKQEKCILKFDYPDALPNILKGIPINMEFYRLCTSDSICLYYSYSRQERTLDNWICDKLHWTPEFLQGLSFEDACTIVDDYKGTDLATMVPLEMALRLAKRSLNSKYTSPEVVMALLRRRDLPSDVRMNLALSDDLFYGVSADSVDVTLAMLRFSVRERIQLLTSITWSSITQGNKASVLARKLMKTLPRR